MKIIKYTKKSATSQKRIALFIGSILLLGTQLPAIGYAQDSGSRSNILEEIVVTARKREESLQDVPAAITALTDSQIDERGSVEIIDLSRTVPGLTFNGNGSVLSAIGLRGIVAATRNIGFESGIGVYVDQVYVGRPAGFNQPLDDIQQVEVLRGPQGTLFGRNTIGGAINITTKKPGDVLEGKVKLTAGNFGRFNASGFLSGPIVDDTLFGKISVYSVTRDGFVNNAFDDSELSDEDRQGYRASLVFSPNENLSITLSADDMEERTNRAFTQFSASDVTSPVFGLYNFALVGNPAVALIPNLTSQDFTPVENRDISGQSLRVEWDLDSGVRIVSITSARETDFLLLADDDTAPAFLSHSTFIDSSEIFTQELRWESDVTDTYDYLFGLYYQDSEAQASRSTAIGTPPPLVGSVNGAGFTVGPVGAISSESSVEGESWAAFANLNYRLSERFTLGLGLRYSNEEKSLVFDQTNTSFTGHPNVSARPLLDDDGISGNISLSYQTENTNYYGSIGRGFKSGGFNPDIVPNADIAFDEESVWTYELGVKSILADGSVRFNAAVFFTDYKDQQVQRLGSSSAGGTGFQISNADSEISGAELELTALPTDNLEIGLMLALTDHEYTNFPNCSTTEDNAPDLVNGGFIQLDCAGNALSYVPDVTYSVSIKYTIPMGFADLVSRIEYSYKDDVFGEPGNFNRTFVDDQDNLDLRIGLMAQDRSWELSAWGRNLGDNEDEQFSWYIPSFQTAYSSYSIGRTLGVDFIYSF